MSDSGAYESEGSSPNEVGYAIIFRETLKRYTEKSDTEWRIIYDSKYPHGPEPSITEDYPHLEKNIRGFCNCDVSYIINHSTAEWNCECSRYDGACIRRCICTNHLKYFYIIENTINGKRLQIGQDCGEEYMRSLELYKKCKLCGRHNEPYLKGPKIMSSQDLCKICAKKQIYTIGSKYRGRTYWDIKTKFPGYCQWVLNLKEPKGKQINKFRDWLIDLKT